MGMISIFIAAVMASSGTGNSAAPPDQPTERPSVQRRYAQKAAHVYLHAGFTGHLRDDFYDSWGGAAYVGFYPVESFAVEAGVVLLHSVLNQAAVKLRNEQGLLPDARAQNYILAVGARYSLGYAKALILEGLLAHFEPHVLLHLGATRAENRWLPTAKVGLGALVHLPVGLQVQLDLSILTQLEQRRRGWVFGVGLMPLLSVGWAFDLRQLGRGD